MGRRKSNRPRMIPEQDKKICGTICICQMTMVLSCVSFVYLGVAIYLPSHKAFNVGIHPVPAMCHTVDNTLSKNCTWASCGEWCLTKTTGICPQFYVTVRQNGTEITMKNCSRLISVSCPPANEDALKRYNCNNNTECTSLTGIFKCRLGHCANMSEIYECQHNYSEGGMMVNSAEDNLKLNGIFHCEKAKCRLVKKDLSCDRYCQKIPTSNANVYLRYANNVYVGTCESAVTLNMANGNKSPPTDIEPKEVWREERNKGMLLASCRTVTSTNNNTRLRATDCINGTVLEESKIPQPYMNFSQFWKLYYSSGRLLDSEQKFIPMQDELKIYNRSRLFINLEGCVNTLRGECKEFVITHGKNGSDNIAESRFPCYYNKNDSFFVVARFDLNKTWLELMIAVCVPGSLFIISFVTLLIITQTVKVGDDARMRCKWCADSNESNVQMYFTMQDEAQQSSPILQRDTINPPFTESEQETSLMQ